MERLRICINKEAEMNRLTLIITESVKCVMESERENQRLYRRERE